MNEEKKNENKEVPQQVPVTPQQNGAQVKAEAVQPVKQQTSTNVLSTPTPTPVQAPQNSVAPTTEKKKESNFKYIMTGVLFVVLFAIIFFLPEISEAIHQFQNNHQEAAPVVPQEEKTSGTLQCTLSKATGVHETTATIRFTFVDKKLKSTITETLTAMNGDPVGEEAFLLGNQQASCEHLKEVTQDIIGFTAECTQEEKEQMTTESIDYEKLDQTVFHENIAEFEGHVPEFQLDQNIDDIKSVMQSSGYSCELR